MGGRRTAGKTARNPPDLGGGPGADGAEKLPLSADYAESRTVREREDARYRKIKADQAQIDLDLARGRVHSLEDCELNRVQQIAVVKRRLLALGREMAPHLAGLEPREIASRLTKRLEEIVDGFANGR